MLSPAPRAPGARFQDQPSRGRDRSAQVTDRRSYALSKVGNNGLV